MVPFFFTFAVQRNFCLGTNIQFWQNKRINKRILRVPCRLHSDCKVKSVVSASVTYGLFSLFGLHGQSSQFSLLSLLSLF